MKKKVSNYIADVIYQQGVREVFTVTGGGAMHMNDAFGHHEKLHCTYQHHEQACAMAAEAYARVDNEMAAVCVTTGPGATNAITGVLGGWMDSIPMLIFSGQARYATMARSTGLHLRSMGIQECDVIPMVETITKYAVLVTDPSQIRYHLEKAIYLACHGRKGPVWLDIPLDVQGAMVEVENLRGYDPGEEPLEVIPQIDRRLVKQVIKRIQSSERPILFPGNGVRLSGGYEEFRQLVEMLGIPVVTGMSSVDALECDHPLYAGRTGTTGERAGNFAVQNSDVLFALGNRLGFMQTGFQYESWARESYTILNDVDEEELKKPSLHVDLPVVGDARVLIHQLLEELKLQGVTREHPLFTQTSWIGQCQLWRKKYPVVTGEQYETVEEGCSNIYAFYQELSRAMKAQLSVFVSVGTSRVAGSQAFQVKKGQRFYTNSNTASMGFDLPAAIGICKASGGHPLVCVTGEGSLQMNIQEFQTIVQNRLPIHLFVINNQGYHSIRQTQLSYFGEPLVGVGEESGDLSFPDLSKLVPAYGLPYLDCHESRQLKERITQALSTDGPCVCEIFVTKYQKTQPKTASKKLEDGRMVSAPLEDMYPFLEREELEENMYIPTIY